MNDARLHVWRGECDSVVAESEEDAWKVWCESTGESRDDYPEQSFEMAPDDSELRIWKDDGDFSKCDCKEKRKAQDDAIEKQRKLIDRLPEAARGSLVGGVSKQLPTDPSGHLKSCPHGHDTKTCEQWAREQGKCFLCSTEW